MAHDIHEKSRKMYLHCRNPYIWLGFIMPQQCPPTFWLDAINMTLQIQDAWPEMHKLFPRPSSIFLIVSYCQFLKSFVQSRREEVPMSSDGSFEVYAALAVAAEEKPVRSANFIGVLDGYVLPAHRVNSAQKNKARLDAKNRLTGMLSLRTPRQRPVALETSRVDQRDIDTYPPHRSRDVD